MKAIYLKPTTEEIRFTSPAIMITASMEGEKIKDGGSTNEGNITEGDSRLRYSVWDDEGEDF